MWMLTPGAITYTLRFLPVGLLVGQQRNQERNREFSLVDIIYQEGKEDIMEERQIRRPFTIMVASIALVLILYFSSFAAEFSADMIQKTPEQTITGKVFMKNQKMRMEMNTPEGPTITIILPEEKKTLLLRPEEKMYLEMATHASDTTPAVMDEKWEEKAFRKHLGTENLNGYLCDKYEITPHDKSMKMTQWISQKLNYPIKIVSQGQYGEMITEYKNIKEGGVNDSLFQVPAGYHKMQIPGMGQGIGPGMAHPGSEE